ncbi:hypothetical protein [Lewinella sp. W8]|uniref:hypothetical protein n=1 Tax=Lewinella sp. W8 TaxID=2528208 RepID=UPI001068CFC5|nr:hypothetical protein [Lewinella sp. W8]MTB50732.1 hypothetical protein [Lewinella sp. W8]
MSIQQNSPAITPDLATRFTADQDIPGTRTSVPNSSLACRVNTSEPNASTAEAMRRLDGYLEQHEPIVNRYDTGFGLNGLSLFYLFRFLKWGHQQDWQTAQKLCWACVEGVARGGKRGSMLIEMSELATFLRHYGSTLDVEESAAPLLALIDDLLVTRMRALIARHDLDAYEGAFQPAWYFVQFPDQFRHLFPEILRAIPADLNATTKAGKYRYATGISHGLACWLSCAAAILRDQPQDPLARREVRALVTALEERRQNPAEAGAYFADGSRGGNSRLSLAYGDAGILFAQWRGALALDDRRMAARILHRLRWTARRQSAEDTGITDNRLLYGRPGAWLFFHRLHTLTGDITFRSAAEYWRDQYYDNRTSGTDLPVFDRYSYLAMQSVSLYEGPVGGFITELAIEGNYDTFYSIFYLN